MFMGFTRNVLNSFSWIDETREFAIPEHLDIAVAIFLLLSDWHLLCRMECHLLKDKKTKEVFVLT